MSFWIQKTGGQKPSFTSFVKALPCSRALSTILQNKIISKGLTQEEKSVFQNKVAPYILIKGVLFKMGADEWLRWYLEKKDRK